MAPPVNLMIKYYNSDKPRLISSDGSGKGKSVLAECSGKGKAKLAEYSGKEVVAIQVRESGKLKRKSPMSPTSTLKVWASGLSSDRPSGSKSTRSNCPLSALASPGSNQGSNSPEFVQPDVEQRRLRRRQYELRRHFQDGWGAQFPWCEPVVGNDGSISQVRCKVCSVVEGHDKLIIPKIDGLWKHAGRRKALKDMTVKGELVRAGQFYSILTNLHVKNERLFLSRPLGGVHRAISGQITIERRKKVVQLKSLMHFMSMGKPMTDYESFQALCKVLNVPDLPQKHWSDNSGWELAQAMDTIVRKTVASEVANCGVISLSADEVTTFDNQSWLSLHGYIVKDWKRFPILLGLTKITLGCGAENIHNMLVSGIMYHGQMTEEDVAKKLVCFAADGAAAFQGCRNGATELLVRETTPYVFGVHCCAHRTSLAADKLSSNRLVAKIEKVVQHVYKYFHKSPKRYSEFEQLAEELELTAQRMLRDVPTQWISILSPMERVQQQLQQLIAKMDADLEVTPVARRNLDLLLDLPTLLAMPALMPLFISVNNLVKFSQDRSTFIPDFLASVKVCQMELYKMYIDPDTAFKGDKFQRWRDITEDHSHLMQQEWKEDMNNNREYLSLRIGNHSYNVHILEGQFREPVGRLEWEHEIDLCQRECRDAARQLSAELEDRFPDADLLNALGIVFPQYWLQPGAESAFSTHLQILKDAFSPRSCLIGEGEERKVTNIHAPLDPVALDAQASYFKLSMTTNNNKVMADKVDSTNPFTRMWKGYSISHLLCTRMPEYFKIAQIAVVTLVGSMEDERTFSNLSFIQNKLRNRLDIHLQTSVKLFCQPFFTIDDFPYGEAYDYWHLQKERKGAAF